MTVYFFSLEFSLQKLFPYISLKLCILTGTKMGYETHFYIEMSPYAVNIVSMLELIRFRKYHVFTSPYRGRFTPPS